jgi:tight adherence protein C
MELTPTIVLSIGGTLTLGLVLSGLVMWLAERRERLTRVRAAAGDRAARGATARGGLRAGQKGAWQKGAVEFMRNATKRITIMKDRQIEETQLLLTATGFRSRDAIVVFTFFKLVSPLVFLAGAALYVYGISSTGKGPYADLGVVAAAALIGSKLPEFVLGKIRDKRLEAIRKALPDALDMLVICAEAGLASDAALKRVVAETGRKNSVLADELGQTAMELGFMPDRRAALDNFARRCPLPSVQAFVNTMIQAEKYGTPLARAFKVLSAEQRNERMMRAEEKAGRLPATMTVPMMIFILPALFIVLIGPAALDIMDNFIGMQR